MVARRLEEELLVNSTTQPSCMLQDTNFYSHRCVPFFFLWEGTIVMAHNSDSNLSRYWPAIGKPIADALMEIKKICHICFKIKLPGRNSAFYVMYLT